MRLRFSPFTIDLDAEALTRDGESVPVRPKSFAVLRHLVRNAGTLVLKNDLFESVWPDTVASEELPRISIRELRRALGDDPRAPRFIETVHGRGYRFIAEVTPHHEGPDQVAPAPRAGEPGILVGRDPTMATLVEHRRRAIAGERQIVFVTGEAGIGKTTLLDAFLSDSEHTPEIIHAASGQCVEQYGSLEPYLPVLEALSALCQGPDSARIRDRIRDGPIPWLAEALGLRGRGPSAPLSPDSHERILRLLAETLEEISLERPFLLVLEDLHWCDGSTVDLINVLARRRGRARLMIAGTLRPPIAAGEETPLHGVMRELRLKSLATEVPLERLPADAIRDFLTRSFPGAEVAPRACERIARQTSGNPFFLVQLVAHLRDHDGRPAILAGEPVQLGIPESLREMIDARLNRLEPPELDLLGAASVVGTEFSSQAVAAALGADDLEEVEDLCEGLVQRRAILRSLGEEEWPDRSIGARYTFDHALYREVLYQRLTPSRRRRLHRDVGRRMSTAYGEQTGEIAGALAEHFERGGEPLAAMRFRVQAARRARERGATSQAVVHLEAALEVGESLTETTEVAMEKFAALLELGDVKLAVLGSEMGAVYERMDALTRRHEIPAGEFITSVGLAGSHLMAAEYERAESAARRLIALPEEADLPGEAAGTFWLGAIAFNRGLLNDATEHLARTGELLEGRDAAHFLPEDSAMSTDFLQMLRLGHQALTLGMCGDVDGARSFAARTAEVSTRFESSRNRAHGACLEAQLHALLDDPAAVAALAPTVRDLATEFELPVLLAEGQFLIAWSAPGDDRLDVMRRAADERLRTGWRVGHSHFLALLAEEHLRAGDIPGTLAVVDEGLRFSRATGERRHEAELYRTRAVALTQSDRPADAIEAGQTSIRVARELGATLLEDRARTRLARVLPDAFSEHDD